MLPPTVLKEQAQSLHMAHPTGTQESQGEQPHPRLPGAVHPPGGMDTSGEEKVGALVWKTSLSLSYLYPNLPRQRNFPSSWETCSRKVVLPLPSPALSSGSTSLH